MGEGIIINSIAQIYNSDVPHFGTQLDLKLNETLTVWIIAVIQLSKHKNKREECRL